MSAYDSVSSSGPTSSVSSINWAHTLGAGSNLVGYCFITAAGGTLRTVSSATYGAQSMTQVTGARVVSPAANSFTDVWRIIAPSGNQTVTFTLSGSQSVVAGGFIVVSDADQTTPDGTPATASVSTAAATTTPASAVGEVVIGACLNDDNFAGDNINVTTGTSRFTIGNGGSSICMAGGTQTGASPTATMVFTETGGANNSPKAAVALSVKTFTGGGGGGGGLPFFMQEANLMVGGVTAKAGGFQ